MEKLKIEIPEGFEVESFDALTAEVTLKPKPKEISHITTVEAALLELTEQDEEVIILRRLQSILPDSCHVVAQQTMVCVTRALVQKWVADWSDSAQPKYYPWFEMRGSSGFRFDVDGRWLSLSVVGSRLCFPNRESLLHSVKYFLPVYKAFMVIE